MWNGEFSEMQKRNKSSEAHKKSLQVKRKKNRTSYIGYSGETKLEFPKMSESEFKIFKSELKKEKKKENIKIVFVVLLITILLIVTTNYII